ncbi:MAG: hypothetical protein ACI4IE_08205 [Eubacterium sp.]
MFNSPNEFLSLLNKVKPGKNNQYTACCPAHDDENPSLSVKFDNGKILLHCFAGCNTEEILNSLGLEKKDLYLSNDLSKSSTNITEPITYEYFNADGVLVYIKKRYCNNGEKSFCFYKPDGTKGIKGIQRVMYNLPNVIKSNTVYVVEGEKCADKLIELGYCATTLDTGANSPWLDTYNKYLENKNLIILLDNDEPGIEYGKKFKDNLPFAKVIKLNDLDEKEDVYDWLEKGHTMDEITNLEEFDILSYFEEKYLAESEVDRLCKETQSETILRLVEENNSVLFHDTANEPYIAVNIDGHKEIWSIDSYGLNIWLNSLYYKAVHKPAKKENITQVLAVLSAKALFENKEPIPLYNRVANKDDTFWYDLTNNDYQSIKITSDNWSLENDTPILFYRYRHQKAQVIPNANGDVNKIFDYINIKNNRTLFLCWLITCFVPDIPHAMPIFYGEQGAAKSTTCRLLKSLIDPSELETLTLNKDERSLMVNLQTHWFLPFDNVSHISEETSDTLCRAITGGGMQQRKLFTNSEDYIFKFKRCIALNGINNVATRSDLLDRAILLELSRISEDERKELIEVEKNFEKDLPYILGGIFNVLSKAKRIRPTVKLDKLPRMADFARWGFAIGEALGGLGDTFIEEYLININKHDIEIINSNVVATLVFNFMKDKPEWEGLVSELYNKLTVLAPSLGINTKLKSFPSQPNVLSRRLNGLKSNLHSVGITFNSSVKANGTIITIKNENSSQLPPYKIEMPIKSSHSDEKTEDIISVNCDESENIVTF